MPAFEEARKIIISSLAALGVEQVGLLDAVGRVLAEDIIAPCDLPQSNNSAMDGYAVQADACQPGSRLKVTGFIQAGGDIQQEVAPGCTIKVMTGARIPAGADAIIPVEDLDEQDGFIIIKTPVTKDDHIRFRGEDVAAGDLVIPSSTVLRPPEIGVLAAFGKAAVPVYLRPRVAILSSGDELLELGAPPVDGKIVNSNSYSLAAGIKEAGAVPVLIGIARDTRESLETKIREGLKADVLITSAGVSAGDLDLVREILDKLEVQQFFWRVDMKPGGPFAYGMRGDTPVFSLPGNPVSTMITFEELVRPALLSMMGHRNVIKRRIAATLTEDVKKSPGKVSFLRVTLRHSKDGYHAALSGNQKTSYIGTMVRADGIALLPKEKNQFAAGETVMVNFIRRETEMEEA
jgi:molybdopterin molybdotransferase